jgi:hypothetical protein
VPQAHQEYDTAFAKSPEPHVKAQALQFAAMSYLLEGKPSKAIAELERYEAWARTANNPDALAEALLKAPGRGAIAAVSPSGLSLDGPAHLYHRALVAEVTSGRHHRLGDALLAAQKAYAQTGFMPELLAIYHLLGDPTTRLR